MSIEDECIKLSGSVYHSQEEGYDAAVFDETGWHLLIKSAKTGTGFAAAAY